MGYFDIVDFFDVFFVFFEVGLMVIVGFLSFKFLFLFSITTDFDDFLLMFRFLDCFLFIIDLVLLLLFFIELVIFVLLYFSL